MPKIFVTGASGFVGSNLVRKLVKQGNLVTVLLRKSSSHPFLKNLEIKKTYGDITDYNSIVKAMKDCDYVIHSAAFISFNRADAKKMHQVNITGTKNIIKAALKLKVKKVVYVSACAAVGYSKKIVNENFNFPKKYKKIAYMHTKHLAEKEAFKASKKGLNITIVNPCTIFGQGDITLNTGSIIKNIKNRRLCAATSGGTAVVSVDDVVDGISSAMKYGKAGQRYILSNENISYIKLFNIIAKELKVNKINKQLPILSYYILYPLVSIIETIAILFNKRLKLNTQVLDFSFKYRYFDSTKAKKELKWKPKVSIQHAVKKAIGFYKKEKLI